MALLDLADVKQQLNILGTGSDALLTMYMSAAVEVVERFTGMTTTQATFTETVDFPAAVLVAHHPLQSVQSVVDSTSGLSVTFTVRGDIIRSSYRGTVTVSYTGGYDTCPGNLGLAGMIIIQQLWTTQRGTMTSAAPDLADSLSYRQMVSGGYAIPNKALELLGEPSPYGFG